MRKFYTDKSSFVILCKNFILSAPCSIKSNCVFTFLFIILSFTRYSAQESIISGIENIHVSDGATVVILDSNNSKIEDSSIENNKTENNEKITIKSNKDLKDKNTFAPKKKLAKIDRQIPPKSQSFITFYPNTETESSFSVHSYVLNIGLNSQDSHKTLDNSILNEKIRFSFVFTYQEKQNILFTIYYSKLLEFNLFTRPPPSILS